MKNKHSWAAFTLLSLTSVAWSQAHADSAAIAKAVEALEARWIQADTTNNTDLLMPLLADTYVSTGMDGRLENKAQTVADAKARKYTSAVDEDVKVTVYGDHTAIATGAYKGTGTDSGKPFEEHLRWTDTWVKMSSGSWQCVATQYTAVKT